MDDVLFGHIHHGTDNRHIRAGQKHVRVKGVKPSFKNQRHHQGFNRIFPMMAERDLVAAQSFGRVIQRPAPHFCAERTGIILLAKIKNHLRDIRLNHIKRNIQFLAPAHNGRSVEGFKSHIEHNPAQFKILVFKFAVQRKGIEQKQAVLSAGNTDRHAISRRNHFKILVRSANVAQHGFHLVVASLSQRVYQPTAKTSIFCADRHTRQANVKFSKKRLTKTALADTIAKKIFRRTLPPKEQRTVLMYRQSLSGRIPRSIRSLRWRKA